MDWYFLDLLASLNRVQFLNGNPPEYVQVAVILLLVAMNYGIWLIPVIPAAIFEMKRSNMVHKAALAAVLIWSAAILSYYIYYACLFFFVGLPNLEFMLFSNRQLVSYWIDLWPPFKRMIVDQFAEWIGIAAIGGGIVGMLSAYIYVRYSKAKKKTATN